jgi:hypothetical protein
MTSILEVKKVIEPVLLENDDIMGIGLTPDRLNIVIYLRVTFDIGFTHIGGYPVQVVLIGQPSIHEVSQRDRVRPLIGSVSAGYKLDVTGTMSGIVYDKYTNSPLLMSNNHVFSNRSTESEPRASRGDPIYQPGGADATGMTNVVATLERYVPWKENSENNLADVALATPTVDYIDGILCNGNVIETNGAAPVTRGERVYKVGRTTGLTEGVIKDIDFTIDVLFDEKEDGSPLYVRFTDQLLIDMKSQRGDSGSLILNYNNQVVGLLFAGGRGGDGASYVVANKIRNVMAIAGVNL